MYEPIDRAGAPLNRVKTVAPFPRLLYYATQKNSHCPAKDPHRGGELMKLLEEKIG